MKPLKIYCIVCFTTLYLFSMSGCKKTEDSTLNLPPEVSFSMDLDFTDSKQKSALETNANVPYHTVAASAISIWSAIAGAQTVVPGAAFKEAFNQIPEQKDSLWVWQYNVVTGNDTYVAKLTGQVIKDSVQWIMKISKVGDSNLSNFVWFTGMSNVSRLGGWWLLNYPKVVNATIVNVPALSIKWSITSDKVRTLQYIYVLEQIWDTNQLKYVDNLNKGGYIKFGLQVDPKYDAYYTIYSKQESKLWQILWNRTTKEGRINLNDVPVGCWDTALADKASCD